jgi:integrase
MTPAASTPSTDCVGSRQEVCYVRTSGIPARARDQSNRAYSRSGTVTEAAGVRGGHHPDGSLSLLIIAGKDTTMNDSGASAARMPWNKGKLIGAKPPLQPKHVWAIRTQLQLGKRTRDLALFNLGIDSKLRGCDLVSLRVNDVAPHGHAVERATVRQSKTKRPVRFELSEGTRKSVDAYLGLTDRRPWQYLFAGRKAEEDHLSTRQYARLVDGWIALAGLDPAIYGTHSLRRTKATLIYRRTGNIRAVQILLGHTKIESTVRYLGVEVDDALALSEQVDV